MALFNFLRINFLLLAIISISFLMPIGVALYYNELDVVPAFVIPAIFCIIIATILYIIGKRKKFTLSPKDSYIVVATAWIFASFLGAIPFLLSGTITNLADAFFESVSGFTTTGATIFSDVESLPKAINFWRCQMHLLGGMGIVALTVALLPLLGVGGFQLIKAETTGPEKGKVTPKITTTAKILWLLYVGLTVIQIILLRIAGMNWFDATCHAFSTLGTGGFSTKNTSIAYYNSPAIEWILAIFMILAGVNFSLYYFFVTGKIDEIKHNSELKAYIGVVTVASIGITIFISSIFPSFHDAFRTAVFQVATIISTTGFASANFALWPSSALIFILLLMFVGGCSGSTAGGIKVIRWVVLSKQAENEVKRLLHPHGVFSIQLNGRAGRKDIVFAVAAFVFLYFLLVIITTAVATLSGIDLLSAFTAALAMIGNIGPGLGAVGPVENFSFFADGIKWWFSFIMLAGRLELYTLLVFLMPSFWKK